MGGGGEGSGHGIFYMSVVVDGAVGLDVVVEIYYSSLTESWNLQLWQAHRKGNYCQDDQ